MTKYEAETCTAISHSLPKIAIELKHATEQLKIANKLKALELKLKIQNNWHSVNSISEVDDIIAGAS